MILITITSTLLLLSISAIHVYWGFGGLWPGKTKQELIDLVFGKANQFPSRLMCLFVACCLVLFAMLPIVWIWRTDLALNGDVENGLKFFIATASLIFFLKRDARLFPIYHQTVETDIRVLYKTNLQSPMSHHWISSSSSNLISFQ